MKKVLSVVLMLVLCLSLVSCGGNGGSDVPASDKQAIIDSGVLRVGMECDYAPFNWMVTEPTETSAPIQSGGYADGYDVYFAQMIADELGVELEVVKLEWTGLTLALEAGTIDLIIAGMSPTPERKATVDFSDAYYNGEKVMIVRKDSEWASATRLEHFSGASVTAQLNNVFYNELIDQIPGVIKAQAYENTPLMIVAVNSGVVDGFIDDLDVAKAVCEVNTELTYVRFEEGYGFVLADEDSTNAVGCRKGSDMVQFVNDILAGVSKEEREALMDKARTEQPLAE